MRLVVCLYIKKVFWWLMTATYLHALCLYEHYMSCFRECDGRKGVISGSQLSKEYRRF
jgi:hypothetical protein